jgi:hypothetical protein
LDDGELSNARRDGRVTKHGYARRLRRELLEQLKPLAAYAVFERDESSCVAPRPCHATDEARPDRIGSIDENDRDAAGDPLEGHHSLSARGKKDIRRERDQFLGVAAREIGIVTSSAAQWF